MGSMDSCLYWVPWGWLLASLKGHALDLEVSVGGHVADGVEVEAVGELERVPIGERDGQFFLAEGDAHLVVVGKRGRP